MTISVTTVLPTMTASSGRHALEKRWPQVDQPHAGGNEEEREPIEEPPRQPLGLGGAAAAPGEKGGQERQAPHRAGNRKPRGTAQGLTSRLTGEQEEERLRHCAESRHGIALLTGRGCSARR